SSASSALPWWSSAPLWKSSALSALPWWSTAPFAPPWWASSPSAPPWRSSAPSAPLWGSMDPSALLWWSSALPVLPALPWLPAPPVPPWFPAPPWLSASLAPPCFFFVASWCSALMALPQSTVSPLSRAPGLLFLPLFRLRSTALLDCVELRPSGSLRPITTRGRSSIILTLSLHRHSRHVEYQNQL
ncbi:hypothetical protein M9458_045808, partial [Cirrhinus mrigala]